MLNIYLLYVYTHPILHCQLENSDLGLTVLKACILTQVISSCPALQVLIRLSRHSHALLMILSSCLPYHLRQHSTERHMSYFQVLKLLEMWHCAAFLMYFHVIEFSFEN